MNWTVSLLLALTVALGSASADIAPKGQSASVGKSVTPGEVLTLVKSEGAARAVVLLDKSGPISDAADSERIMVESTWRAMQVCLGQ